MPMDRALMLTDLASWLALDDARRAVLRECAMRLGMPAGRRWIDIPDADLERMYRAVFAGDFASDEEFDAQINF